MHNYLGLGQSELDHQIRANATIVRKLATQRKDLLTQIPFGRDLDRTRFDTDRVASPVVAVVGSFSAGKSSLINAMCGENVLPIGVTPTTMVPIQLRGREKDSYYVGTKSGGRNYNSSSQIIEQIKDKDSLAQYVIIETRHALQTPWDWLDMPGTNLQIAKEIDFEAMPSELADVCVLVTSLIQPLSLSDVSHIMQLRRHFPGNRLCIAVTRSDQGTAQQRNDVRRYIDDVLKDVIPGDKLAVFTVSTQSHMQIDQLNDLKDYLRASVLDVQATRLQQLLKDWESTLDDLQKLMDLRDCPPLDEMRLLDAKKLFETELVHGILAIKKAVPQVGYETSMLISKSLPAQERDVFNALRENLSKRTIGHVRVLVEQLHTKANGILGLGTTNSPAKNLAEILSHLFLLNLPTFVDHSAAFTGTLLGGLVDIMVASSDWRVPQQTERASRLGGMLGGLVGGGKMLFALEHVRSSAEQPLVLAIQTQLDAVCSQTQVELARYFELLKNATKMQSSNPNLNEKLKVLPPLVKVAQKMLSSLNAEFKKSKNG